MAVVPFETVPVLEVARMADVAEHIPDLAQANLGIVSVAHTTEQEFATFKPLAKPIAAEGLMVDPSRVPHTRNKGLSFITRHNPARDPNPYAFDPYYDIGLHLDAGYNPGATEITAHRTRIGRGTALFFDFQPGVFTSQPPVVKSSGQKFEQATKLIREGLIDDAVFVPRCYMARTVPGTTLFFQRGSARPLAHMFETSRWSWRRHFETTWIYDKPTDQGQ